MESQNRDSFVTTWREPERVSKIRIERNQPPILNTTDLDQSRIGDRTKILLRYGRDFETAITKQRRTSGTEVFIELDFQTSYPTCTVRSRVISEA